MRFTRSIALVFVAGAVVGCADSAASAEHATPAADDAARDNELDAPRESTSPPPDARVAAPVAPSPAAAASPKSVIATYTVKGAFVARHYLRPKSTDPRVSNGTLPSAPADDALGSGTLTIEVTKRFYASVPDSDDPEEHFIADVRVEYPVGQVFEETDVTFVPTLIGYGPPSHVAKLTSSSVSLSIELLWSKSPSDLEIRSVALSFEAPDTLAPIDGIPVDDRLVFVPSTLPVAAQ